MRGYVSLWIRRPRRESTATKVRLESKREKLNTQTKNLGQVRDLIYGKGIKLFELLQASGQEWFQLSPEKQRRLVDLLCSNLTLSGTSLEAEIRKPFQILSETASARDGWGTRIRT